MGSCIVWRASVGWKAFFAASILFCWQVDLLNIAKERLPLYGKVPHTCGCGKLVLRLYFRLFTKYTRINIVLPAFEDR